MVYLLLWQVSTEDGAALSSCFFLLCTDVNKLGTSVARLRTKRVACILMIAEGRLVANTNKKFLSPFCTEMQSKETSSNQLVTGHTSKRKVRKDSAKEEQRDGKRQRKKKEKGWSPSGRSGNATRNERTANELRWLWQRCTWCSLCKAVRLPQRLQKRRFSLENKNNNKIKRGSHDGVDPARHLLRTHLVLCQKKKKKQPKISTRSPPQRTHNRSNHCKFLCKFLCA